MKELKGLIYKDWSLMGRQLKFLIVYILIFIVLFSFTSTDSSFLASFFSVIIFMLGINCFAYDEQVHFDKLVAASPISPLKVVLSRYIACLTIGVAGGIVIGLVNYAVLVYRRSPEASPDNSLLTLALGAGIAVLFVSILFPLIYKFGVNKSRLLLILICGTPAIFVALLFTLLPKNFLNSLSIPVGVIESLPFIISLFLIALLFFSVYLSTRIVIKKDY